MLRFALLALCAALAFGLVDCTVKSTGAQRGTVMQDGSVYLGFSLVSRKQDKDWMLVGDEYGYFSSVRFSVNNRPFILDRMVLDFGSGEQWNVPVNGKFAPGSWSPELKLPSQQTIRKVTYYGKAGGKKGQMAKVSLYGRR